VKILFVDTGGSLVGAAIRFERDGHETMLALTGEAGVGEGLVNVRSVKPEVRALTRLLVEFPADVVVVGPESLCHLTTGLRGATRALVLGPEREAGVGLALRWDVRFRGRVRVGNKLVLFYGGGVVVQPGSERVLATALVAGSEPLPISVDSGGFFLTEFLSDEGAVVRATEEVLPWILGPLFELIDGNVGELFSSPRVCERSTGMALGVDAKVPGAKLGEVANAALRHLYPVGSKFENGQLTALEGVEPLAFVTSWGVDVYEAARRCYRTLDRCKGEGVRLLGHVAPRLGAMLGQVRV
jgi:hypothetical protein